jgi:hypothetical protein
MRPISSRATFFYKRIFPIIWFGLLLLFIANAAFSASRSDQIVPGLFIPIAMIVIGYFVMKRLVFDLVDQVLDAGNALLVRNGGQEERIVLTDIKNVNYAALMSPPRVTLSLRRPCIFGSQISFCAPLRLVPFSTSPIIDELIERVDAARAK